jgi:hypothetical protein
VLILPKDNEESLKMKKGPKYAPLFVVALTSYDHCIIFLENLPKDTHDFA